MSRHQLDELLGALALDAVDDERADADEALQTDVSAAEALATMRGVVALMGEADTVTPPTALRRAVLDAAATIAPATVVEPAEPAAVYRAMVEAMIDRLSRLEDAAWTRIAWPYEWTVQGLVAHLTSIERYTASKLGLIEFEYPEDREMDHLGLGEHVIDEELGRPPSETFAGWREAAGLVLAHAEAASSDRLGEEVTFHGFPVRISTLLILRSFEIWTHVDDIARANGLDLTDPSPAALRAMSNTSVGLARWVMRFMGVAPDDGGIRLVLTGDGGGVFPVRFGSVDTVDVTVVADVIDYCRMAAQRIAPADLRAEIEGDEALAARFLVAAATLAV